MEGGELNSSGTPTPHIHRVQCIAEQKSYHNMVEQYIFNSSKKLLSVNLVIKQRTLMSTYVIIFYLKRVKLIKPFNNQYHTPMFKLSQQLIFKAENDRVRSNFNSKPDLYQCYAECGLPAKFAG